MGLAAVVCSLGLAQLGDPVDDRHPALAATFPSLDHVELVGVELREQGHDLGHREVVVVLDGKELILDHGGLPLIGLRRHRRLGHGRLCSRVSGHAPPDLIDAVEDRHPALGLAFAVFDHVEFVGVELGHEREDLGNLEVVVVLDGKEAVATVVGRSGSTYRGQRRPPGCRGVRRCRGDGDRSGGFTGAR